MTAKKEPHRAGATNSVRHRDAAAAAPAARARGEAQRSPYIGEDDLLVTATGARRLGTFANAIRSAGLADLLKERGPYTIFAPTDQAFARLPKTELDALLEDGVRLAKVLSHHVVPGRVKAPKLDAPRMAMPVFGDELTLTKTADAFRVDHARLVKTNIRAKNGVIHAIDTVLMPR